MITISFKDYEITIEAGKDRELDIWLYNPEGEGMMLDTKQFEELLDKFWKYHF